MSKCGKNMGDTLCHFSVCTQWNLFVKIISARHADRIWLFANRR